MSLLSFFHKLFHPHTPIVVKPPANTPVVVNHEPSPLPTVKPIVVNGELVSIDIEGLEGFSPAEVKFLTDAMVLEAKVIASLTFHNRATSMHVSETNGDSLEGVYQKVISGADNHSPKADKIFNLYLIMYNQPGSNTIGYNYMDYKEWVNKSFFDAWMKEEFGLAMLAGHLFHEYLHLCGYMHRWSHRGTLVYEWGYLVRDIGTGIMKGEVVSPKLSFV